MKKRFCLFLVFCLLINFGLFARQDITQAASSVDLIPTMTSNTAPYGIAKASSAYSDDYDAYKAFDDKIDNRYWCAKNGSLTGWLEYEFASPIVVDQYTLNWYQYDSSFSYMPKNWTFEAYDGTAWIILDRQTDQFFSATSRKRVYPFYNSVEYKRYRINVSANGGASYLGIGEMEMMQRNMPLQPPNGITTTSKQTSILVSWMPVSGAISYDIEVDGVQHNDITGTSYEDLNLLPATEHTYRIRTKSNSEISSWSSVVIASTFPDLIPTMTSNTAPYGVAKASTAYSTDFDAYKAFDDKIDDKYWCTINGYKTGWLEYEFASPIVVDQYTLSWWQYDYSFNYMPKDWTFEAYDGKVWIILDRQTNQSFNVSNRKRTYLIDNALEYKKYRINVSANGGGLYLGIGEMEMMQRNMPLQPPNGITTTSKQTSILVSWMPVSGAISYDIEVDGVPHNDITGTSYEDLNLLPATEHTYRIRTKSNSEISSWSSVVIASTLASNPNPDLIPTMTSNTAPYGIVRASTVYSSDYDAYKAFDDKNDNRYWSTINGYKTGWLEYEFPSPTVVDQYTLSWLTQYNVGFDYMPKDWTFEAYDGSAWVILDRQTNQSFNTTVRKRTYSFYNSLQHKRYRINVSANGGAIYVAIGEMEMMQRNIPLQPPNGITTTPKQSSILVSWTPVSGATGYDVEVDGIVIDNQSNCNYLHSDIIPNTHHTYRVRTKSDTSIGQWSSLSTTTTLPGGLKAEYFNNMDFTNPISPKVDSTIKFDWGLGAPDVAIEPDTFSVRWTGQLIPKNTEEYTFYTLTDDGVRLWINGQLLVEKWTNQSEEHSGSIFLEANKRYDIKMEYYERTGGATAKLMWSSVSQAKEIIDQNRLTTDYSVVDANVYSTTSGLIAEYFDNLDFTNLVLTRIDGTINYEWNLNAPVSEVDSETFSVRWTGKINPKYTEEYTFYTSSDDGIRVWINNQLIIDNWDNPTLDEQSGTISLVAGHEYDIKVEYFDNTLGAAVGLLWSSASQPKEVIQQSYLSH